MIREVIYGIVGILLAAYALDFVFSLSDDPREPRRVRPKIPLIGHFLGIMRIGPVYYSHTSEETDEEIHTLGIFNYKVYISTSTRLLPMIQKQKTLSFRPFLQIVAKRHGDATDETYEIFGGKFADDLSHYVRTSLAPGPALDEQNLRMGKRVLVDLDELLSAKKAHLLKWCRRVVVQASSCGVYGEDHPFLDAEVEKAFWKWMDYLTTHLIAGLDFFGRGYAAREIVFKAYMKYCKQLPADCSHLAREHQRSIREAGICETDNAKQASIFTIAAFSNSAPSLYWTVFELFSRPEILAEVRKELELHTIRGSRSDGYILDAALVKSKCPLLLSVFQETQRTRHINASFRMVMSDTMLDNRYLLKKGNFLQMPGNPVHMNTAIWGQNAHVFDPYRFVPKKGESSMSANSGFVPWGAAPYLCPARQFASTEILIIVALLAIRADLKPVDGIWEKNPGVSFQELSTLLNPKIDINLNISVRDQWAGKWDLKMGESRSRVSLASG